MSSRSHLESMLSQLSEYKERTRIRDEVFNVMTAVQSLAAKIGTLVLNDGSDSRLLILHGTMPIFYQNNQYNIPVEIFIMSKFPVEAPMVFLRPTSDMQINTSHPNVNREGLVSIPYLSSWTTSSSLQELITFMSSAFSATPPLYAKPNPDLQPSAMKPEITGPQPRPARNPSPTQSLKPPPAAATLYNPNAGAQYSQFLGSNLGMSSISGPGGSYRYDSSSGPVTQPQYSKVQVPHTGQTVYNPNPADVKAGLLEAVSLKLAGMCQVHLEDCAVEIDVAKATKMNLEAKKLGLGQAIADLSKQKADLEQALIAMQLKNKELSDWEQDAVQKPVKDIEDHLQPYDEVSEQLVRLSAEVCALDDVIDTLSMGYKKGGESRVGSFLQNIRRLSHQQFLAKAHIVKIRQVLQAQSILLEQPSSTRLL